jgi:ubiquinone/menaquinone biosynthesis C-methylase UbiE
MSGREPERRVNESLALEFGIYTKWISDAIRSLALDDPIPAMCRGTGNPVLFARLASYVEIAPGDRFLDVGCGMGGPAEWFRRRSGPVVYGVDVMTEELSEARAFFPTLSLSAASVSELPFPDGAFDGAWALGVLEMVDDATAVLAELHRVLAPEAVAVAFVHVRHADTIDDPPISDSFYWPDEIEAVLEKLSFEVIESDPLEDLKSPPEKWTAVSRQIRAHIAAAHGEDPRHQAVSDELERFANALRRRDIRPWLFAFRRRQVS